MPFGQALKNWGQLASYGAKMTWNNPTGRAALIGGGLGAAYGAMSDNTSMLGGVMMGAGLGAGTYRYGIRPMQSVGRMNISAGMGFGSHAKAYGGALGSAMGKAVRRDARALKFGIKSMMSNYAFNPIRGIGGGLA